MQRMSMLPSHLPSYSRNNLCRIGTPQNSIEMSQNTNHQGCPHILFRSCGGPMLFGCINIFDNICRSDVS